MQDEHRLNVVARAWREVHAALCELSLPGSEDAGTTKHVLETAELALWAELSRLRAEAQS